jgi:hypothetical protein
MCKRRRIVHSIAYHGHDMPSTCEPPHDVYLLTREQVCFDAVYRELPRHGVSRRAAVAGDEYGLDAQLPKGPDGTRWLVLKSPNP